jgi:hypothetical protein
VLRAEIGCWLVASRQTTCACRPCLPRSVPGAGLACGIVKLTHLIGLIVAGIVVGVVGTVVRFSTTVHSSGFNVHKVGDVLVAVGIVLIVVGALIEARRRNAARR